MLLDCLTNRLTDVADIADLPTVAALCVRSVRAWCIQRTSSAFDTVIKRSELRRAWIRVVRVPDRPCGSRQSVRRMIAPLSLWLRRHGGHA